ncbi:RNA polymerase sigma-70 factor [Mucilaginibacter sp. CSA2-8R]|uniref:RNA polymerase sigma-70 factor n=1 Tax=Mucilaginibacter sp. CSA2-8R TaxID=3141542 RepID=UPI00315CDCBE
MQQINPHNSATEIDFRQEETLNSIYLGQYAGLHRYAFTFMQDAALAEEMVHHVFLKLLERDTPLVIHTSLKSYLYRSVYHECLNSLKQQKPRQNFNTGTAAEPEHTETPAAKLQYTELETQVHAAIGNLPEQCRTIFQLSRFEELKYHEIATRLGLSIKTVETQMSRALKKLRISLADYLPLLAPALTKLFTLLIHRHDC